MESKLRESDFVDIICKYDLIFLSECWVRTDTILDVSLLNGEYDVLTFPRTKGAGGGLVVLFRKKLAKYRS